MEKPDQDITMGVLGVGRMGRYHGTTIQQTGGLRLVAVSSRSEHLADQASRELGVPACRAHEELLDRSDIEWIVVATRSQEHAHWAREALARGKDVIVEKPIALTYPDAASVVEFAEKQGRRITAYQSRRWDRDFQWVEEMLSSDLLGHVYRIESRRAGFSSGWAGWGTEGMDNPWRLKEAYGGGQLNDWGPHLVDQLLQLIGRMPRTVYGRLERQVWTTEADDHFWAELDFGEGFTARVEGSNNHRIPLPRWYLLGSAGSAEVAGTSRDAWDHALVRRKRGSFEEEIHYDVSQEELASGFYEALAAAIRAGEPLPIIPDQILDTMVVVDAVRESARTGSPVTPERRTRG